MSPVSFLHGFTSLDRVYNYYIQRSVASLMLFEYDIINFTVFHFDAFKKFNITFCVDTRYRDPLLIVEKLINWSFLFI